MARKSPSTEGGHPQKIIDKVVEGYNTGTSVGTTATALPATNRSNRRGLVIQNQDTAAYIYIGAAKPTNLKSKTYSWKPSGSGTNEWYCVLASTLGDPSLDETLRLYSGTSAAETLRTNATVGSLSAQEWDWGDGDSLGYDTLYIRTAGTDPSQEYASIQSYYNMPTTSGATVGYEIGPKDAVYFTFSGSVRVWCIADTTTTLVCTIEET